MKIQTNYKTATPPPIPEIPQLSGYEPKSLDAKYDLGFYKSRETYKRIKVLATRQWVPDYNNDPRFYCFYNLYIDFLVNDKYGIPTKEMLKDIKLMRFNYKTELQEVIPEGSKAYQQSVSKSVSEFAGYLAQLYEEQDRAINDPDDYDHINELYNYQGTNDLWLFTTSNRYNDILPLRYNEVQRWRDITMSLTPQAFGKFLNPFITTLIEPYLRKDAQTYVTGTNDVKSGLQSFMTNLTRAEMIRKTEILENPTAKFPDHNGGGRFLTNPQRIQCAEDVNDILNFYQILLKFHNLHNTSKARPTKSVLMQLFNSKDRGSLQSLAEKANNRVGRYDRQLEILKQAPETDRNNELIPFLHLWKDRNLSLADALYSCVNFLSSTAEDYLVDKNNRNATGAISALQAYESGSWKNQTEELNNQAVLKVQFDKSTKSEYNV